MIKTLNFTTDVPPSREVKIALPDDVPAGPADIVIVIAPRVERAERTLGDLSRSEFVGMWRDRADITDSADFARQLRADAWGRAS